MKSKLASRAVALAQSTPEGITALAGAILAGVWFFVFFSFVFLGTIDLLGMTLVGNQGVLILATLWLVTALLLGFLHRRRGWVLVLSESALVATACCTLATNGECFAGLWLVILAGFVGLSSFATLLGGFAYRRLERCAVLTSSSTDRTRES
jgi:hypothetical protein